MKTSWTRDIVQEEAGVILWEKYSEEMSPGHWICKRGMQQVYSSDSTKSYDIHQNAFVQKYSLF